MPTPFDTLLHDFAATHGLSGDDLLQTHEILVDGLPVNLIFEGLEDVGDLVFYTTLGQPAPGTEAAAYRSLLLANNLWAATGGGTLGLLSDGTVSFCYRTPLEGLTVDTLSDTLALFTSQAQNWINILASEETLTDLAAAA